MERPNSLYLLIGSRSPNYDPSRQIEMLGLGDRVQSTGYVSQGDFPYYLAASDVCLNLRYPTAGETSASLLRIMGAGVPVLVSRTGSFEELPDEAVGKVDVDDTEEELLLEYLLLLARRPDLRVAMSEAARRYIAEHHTLEAAAEGYLRFIAHLGNKSSIEPDIELASNAPAIVHTQTPSNAPQARQIQALTQVPTTARDLPDDDPIAVLSNAAADLGIEENDQAVLEWLAGSIEGLLPADRT